MGRLSILCPCLGACLGRRMWRRPRSVCVQPHVAAAFQCVATLLHMSCAVLPKLRADGRRLRSSVLCQATYLAK